MDTFTAIEKQRNKISLQREVLKKLHAPESILNYAKRR